VLILCLNFFNKWKHFAPSNQKKNYLLLPCFQPPTDCGTKNLFFVKLDFLKAEYRSNQQQVNFDKLLIMRVIYIAPKNLKQTHRRIKTLFSVLMQNF